MSWKDNTLLRPAAPKSDDPLRRSLEVGADRIASATVIAAALQDAKGAPPAQKGNNMVAKVSGFARLASIVHDLNNNAGSMADDLAAQLQDEAGKIKSGMEAAKNNVANLRATRMGLDALNAAFGNGGPPLDGSSTAGDTSKS